MINESSGVEEKRSNGDGGRGDVVFDRRRHREAWQ